MKRLLLFCTYAIILCCGVSAQRTLGTVLFGIDKPKKIYMGQYADNNRDRTGSAMQLLKDGSLYVGDFVNGSYEGYGMMVAGTKGTLDKIPGAMVYVGEWIDGKRNGRGTCYGTDGEIVYKGIFADNMPTDPYPTIKANDNHYFSDTENYTNNEYYIGEMLNGKPDGFGIFILPNGARSIGRVRNGKRYGIAVIVFEDREWMLVKYDPKVNGYTVISSTEDLMARREQYARAQAKITSELRESLLDLANSGLQLANEIQSQSNKNNGGNINNYSSYSSFDSQSTTTSGHKSNHGNKATSKANDCGTAWMQAKRTYSDYETQLAPNGSRTATDISQRRSIRSKMRSLRQKWEARGCQFTKSPYEDENE